jgi:hypothetical protein
LELIINIIEQFRWFLHLRAILAKDIKDITPKDAANLSNNLATEKMMNRGVERCAVSE